MCANVKKELANVWESLARIVWIAVASISWICLSTLYNWRVDKINSSTLPNVKFCPLYQSTRQTESFAFYSNGHRTVGSWQLRMAFVDEWQYIMCMVSYNKSGVILYYMQISGCYDHYLINVCANFQFSECVFDACKESRTALATVQCHIDAT